jgi:hypothetical protein
MSANVPPALPPRQGGLEHKPTKVDGGLPVPTLIKVPPPPPKSSGGKK